MMAVMGLRCELGTMMTVMMLMMDKGTLGESIMDFLRGRSDLSQVRE